MQREIFTHESDDSIPKGFRIRTLLEQQKYIVEKAFCHLWFKERKPCLTILTQCTQQAHYNDRHGRGYYIILSDGECKTYGDALEFLSYEPFRPYMSNSNQQEVFELWAKNNLALKFIGATLPYKEHHVSRVGLFLSVPGVDTYFEPKGGFWENSFTERYGLRKIS